MPDTVPESKAKHIRPQMPLLNECQAKNVAVENARPFARLAAHKEKHLLCFGFFGIKIAGRWPRLG